MRLQQRPALSSFSSAIALAQGRRTAGFGGHAPTPSASPKGAATPAGLHLIHDIPLHGPGDHYNALVEIPAGQLAKLQVDMDTGQMEHEVSKKTDKARYINYLPYPANYGSLPQTLSDKQKGGDGDPLDVFVLTAAQPSGTVAPVRVIGGIDLYDHGERDLKVLGLQEGPNMPFKDVSDIQELDTKHPGVTQALRRWLYHYKGTPSPMVVKGVLNREAAVAQIEQAHQDWAAAYASQKPATPREKLSVLA
jgi:inorganic pyrophosphatase